MPFCPQKPRGKEVFWYFGVGQVALRRPWEAQTGAIGLDWYRVNGSPDSETHTGKP